MHHVQECILEKDREVYTLRYNKVSNGFIKTKIIYKKVYENITIT